MKLKLVLATLRCGALLLLLYLSVTMLKNPYPESFATIDAYPYGEGNATGTTREQIIATLRELQQGYTARDVASADRFAEQMLSRDNLLILGTMPREIYLGHDAATRLIRDDWAEWGDCRFHFDRANVSVHGEVAWFATIGYVEFDLSRFLVLPLRLTGVLVNEDGSWRFQHLQYQLDLDLSWHLLLVMVLIVLNVMSILLLFVQLVRGLVARRRSLPQA